MDFIVQKVQATVTKVEEWSCKWDVTFSVIETKLFFFKEDN